MLCHPPAQAYRAIFEYTIIESTDFLVYREPIYTLLPNPPTKVAPVAPLEPAKRVDTAGSFGQSLRSSSTNSYGNARSGRSIGNVNAPNSTCDRSALLILPSIW